MLSCEVKPPFLGSLFLSRSDRILASSILLRRSLATWKDFSLLKMFIMKHLTNFRTTVESGVDPRLAKSDTSNYRPRSLLSV